MALAHSGCQRFPKLTISCWCFSSRPGEQTTRVLLTFVVIHISTAIQAFVSLSYSPSSSPSSTCFVSISPTLCLPMSLKTHSLCTAMRYSWCFCKHRRHLAFMYFGSLYDIVYYLRQSVSGILVLVTIWCCLYCPEMFCLNVLPLHT